LNFYLLAHLLKKLRSLLSSPSSKRHSAGLIILKPKPRSWRSNRLRLHYLPLLPWRSGDPLKHPRRCLVIAPPSELALFSQTQRSSVEGIPLYVTIPAHLYGAHRRRQLVPSIPLSASSGNPAPF
jgi:hypothetical protein